MVFVGAIAWACGGEEGPENKGESKEQWGRGSKMGSPLTITPSLRCGISMHWVEKILDSFVN